MPGPGAASPGPEAEGRERPSAALLAAALEASGRLVAAACLSAMFLALLVHVVLRHAFGSGIPWACEIHAVLFPWLVAGGVVVASARGRHIAITILPGALDEQGRSALLVAIDLAVLAIALGVLWSSQPVILASRFQRLSALGVTPTGGYASLVHGFGLIALLAALDALRPLLGGSSGTGDPARQSLS